MLRLRRERTYLHLGAISFLITAVNDGKLEGSNDGLLALGDALGGGSGLLGNALGGLEAGRGMSREGGDGHEDGDDVLHFT